MAVQFPFLAVASARGDAALMPLLPLELSYQNGPVVVAQGLLDTGATVNVLPYSLGIQLGATWDAQTIRVTLGGNLASQEARGIVLEGRVAGLPPVPLVFAWTRAENVPLLLGQVNFFDEFDVSFHRARRHFTVETARK